jgi:hypothetical protein
MICGRIDQRRKAKHKTKKTQKGYTTMSNQSNTRKARVTSNDIVMAYMLEGIDSVSRSLVDHTNPTKCLDDAMDKMLQRNASVDVSQLQQLREKFAQKKH